MSEYFLACLFSKSPWRVHNRQLNGLKRVKWLKAFSIHYIAHKAHLWSTPQVLWVSCLMCWKENRALISHMLLNTEVNFTLGIVSVFILHMKVQPDPHHYQSHYLGSWKITKISCHDLCYHFFVVVWCSVLTSFSMLCTVLIFLTL